jgi:hypothetical protein
MAMAEASRLVRWYAYTGCLAVIPFVIYGFRLPWYGTAVVLGGALAAWGLLLSVIRPAATRIPVAAVWIVAAVLAGYGTASLMLHGAVTAGGLAAGGYGWALAVAAVSYQRRYRAALRSAAERISSRSSSGARISASGPRPSNWV